MGRMANVKTRPLRSYRAGTRQTPNSEFDDEDKRKLLTALKKYGHRNTKMLAKALPHKTEEQIKVFVEMKMRNNRIYVQSDIVNRTKSGKMPVSNKVSDPDFIKSPIDKWLYKMEEARSGAGIGESTDLSKLLAKCMLFTSRFEAHPLPRDCGGVNYKELYEYLYLVMSGYPLRELSKRNSEVVMDCIARLADMVHYSKVGREIIFLDKCQRMSYLQKGELKVYGRKKKQQAQAEEEPVMAAFNELKSMIGLNPLNVPLDLLLKDEKPESEEQ